MALRIRLKLRFPPKNIRVQSTRRKVEGQIYLTSFLLQVKVVGGPMVWKNKVQRRCDRVLRFKRKEQRYNRLVRFRRRKRTKALLASVQTACTSCRVDDFCVMGVATVFSQTNNDVKISISCFHQKSKQTQFHIKIVN